MTTEEDFFHAIDNPGSSRFDLWTTLCTLGEILTERYDDRGEGYMALGRWKRVPHYSDGDKVYGFFSMSYQNQFVRYQTRLPVCWMKKFTCYVNGSSNWVAERIIGWGPYDLRPLDAYGCVFCRPLQVPLIYYNFASVIYDEAALAFARMERAEKDFINAQIDFEISHGLISTEVG